MLKMKYILFYIPLLASFYSYGNEEHLTRMNAAPDHIKDKYFYSFDKNDYEEDGILFGIDVDKAVDKAMNKVYNLTKSFAPAAKAVSFVAKCSGPGQCMESAVQEVLEPQPTGDGTIAGTYAKNSEQRKAFLQLRPADQKNYLQSSQNLKNLFADSEKAITKDLGPKPKKFKCNSDKSINSFDIPKERGFPTKTRITLKNYSPVRKNIPREILVQSARNKDIHFKLEFNNKGKVSRIQSLSKKSPYPSKTMSLDQLKRYIKKNEENYLNSKDPIKESSYRVFRKNQQSKKMAAWFDKLPTYIQAYNHDMLNGCDSSSIRGSYQKARLSEK